MPRYHEGEGPSSSCFCLEGGSWAWEVGLCSGTLFSCYGDLAEQASV